MLFCCRISEFIKRFLFAWSLLRQHIIQFPNHHVTCVISGRQQTGSETTSVMQEKTRECKRTTLNVVCYSSQNDANNNGLLFVNVWREQNGPTDELTGELHDVHFRRGNICNVASRACWQQTVVSTFTLVGAIKQSWKCMLCHTVYCQALTALFRMPTFPIYVYDLKLSHRVLAVMTFRCWSAVKQPLTTVT